MKIFIILFTDFGVLAFVEAFLHLEIALGFGGLLHSVEDLYTSK